MPGATATLKTFQQRTLRESVATEPAIEVAGILLLLLIGYAFSWVFAFIGLIASSPEAANAYGFTFLFPITFISSAFIPVDTMPSWLQPFAEHNPFSTMVDAARALFLGTPAATTCGSRSCGASASSPSSAGCPCGATAARSCPSGGRAAGS
jgi:ABC-type uncharacterized transport system permease subunit